MPGIDLDAIEDDWADDEPGRRPRRKKLSSKAQARIAEYELARVVGVDRGRVTVLWEGREVDARFAGSMRGTKVVVADEVRVKPPRHETDQARIVERLPRRTVLVRTADDGDDEERVVVANADQVVVVLTADRLEGGIGFLDRVLVAAAAGGLGAALCINKLDLIGEVAGRAAEVGAVADRYRDLGHEVVLTSARTGEGMADLLGILRERWSAFAGHSGVGKTSLFNVLVPGVERPVAEIGRHGGRHTTVSSRAHHLLDVDAWLIDTPGVRSFGLASIGAAALVDHFPEFSELDRDQRLALINGEQIEVPGAHPARLAAFHRLRQALLDGDVDDEPAEP